MSELKPCPFCGSGAIEVCAWETSTDISCLDCDYTIKCCDCDEEDAVDYWNTRPAEDAKDKEIERLKKQLSDSADEGYVGFMLGIEQMKKKLAEKDKEIERLKAALSDISKIAFEGKIGDKVARETARRITNSALAPDTNVGTMEDGK